MADHAGAWGKLYESTFTGSMYGLGPVTIAVWCYAVAHIRPPAGTVELNPKLLSGVLGCPKEDVERAIEILCSPDAESRSPSEEGRRLLRTGSFEYRAVNFDTYRAGRQDETRRQQNREAQRRFRERASAEVSRESKHSKPPSAQAEAEAEAEETKPCSSLMSGVVEKPSRKKRATTGAFDRFWAAYPRKASKGRAERAFATINPDEQLVGRMCAAIELAKTSDQWRKDGGKFIPHPATWLNATGWEDEPEKPAQEDDGYGWLKGAI